MTIEFEAWPKTPRLNRDIVITEKIDGTNAAIIVTDDGAIAAQSRKRLITPEDDNFGFARWVRDNADHLASALGPGRHFGEWWGSGIQRGYGLTKGEKRFSLFRADHYSDAAEASEGLFGVVPVLYRGPFSERSVKLWVDELRENGSAASPGAKAEGVIVYHTASRQVYKVLCENDELPKSAA